MRRPALPVSFLIQIFTISMAAIMVRFSITAFLAVYAVPALGHPHSQLRQPIGFLGNNPALTPRASTDSACPDGYLCGQESCSSDFECPIGTNCIAFGSGVGTAMFLSMSYIQDSILTTRSVLHLWSFVTRLINW